MAKKKQEYSGQSVDEMVERLKRSYESAERDDGDDADPEADDEAFAKMLVEMFGNGEKSKPAAKPKSTDLYSAEDFMPDDQEDDVGATYESPEDEEEDDVGATY
ncbi:MAG: hypothetical protein J6V39_05170 [Clostridia bacterium]|nr:hypothetical protein [Clostridia bacterium]